MQATDKNSVRLLTKKKKKSYGMLRATKHDKRLRLKFFTKKKKYYKLLRATKHDKTKIMVQSRTVCNTVINNTSYLICVPNLRK